MCLSVAIHRPDDVLASGEHVGFRWMVIHNGMGYRCGYVRVLPGHPWFGKHYDELEAKCHGDLTFAEPDVNCDKGGADNGWWLGFDCAHGFDLPDPNLPRSGQVPSYASSLLEFSGAFVEPLLGINNPTDGSAVRSQEYVEAECHSLCEQAAKAMEVVVNP